MTISEENILCSVVELVKNLEEEEMNTLTKLNEAHYKRGYIRAVKTMIEAIEKWIKNNPNYNETSKNWPTIHKADWENFKKNTIPREWIVCKICGKTYEEVLHDGK